MKPLQGCRVLDLGIITAGAATSALLADLGADVIKIESSTYRDPFRLWTSEPAPAAGDDLPPFFRMTNRNKRSLGLDLKQSEGRDAILRLAAECDIVVENFSRGVLDRLGIGYAALRQARSGIILASISSQGETGPDANYVSFGSTLEAVAGLAWTTGYAGGVPTVSGIELNYPDQVVALFAAAMIVTAWRERKRTGQGAHLDLAQRELTSFLAGDAFAETAAGPIGNAQADYVVQDCFVCADGLWIAVSVAPETMDAFANIVGNDASAWALTQSAAACLERLRSAGITSRPVLDANDVMAGMGRDWHMAMQSMPDGRMVKGFPFQFSTDAMSVTRPAAALGTHTRDILTEVGGFSPDEIDRLIGLGVAQVAEKETVA